MLEIIQNPNGSRNWFNESLKLVIHLYGLFFEAYVKKTSQRVRKSFKARLSTHAIVKVLRFWNKIKRYDKGSYRCEETLLIHPHLFYL